MRANECVRRVQARLAALRPPSPDCLAQWAQGPPAIPEGREQAKASKKPKNEPPAQQEDQYEIPILRVTAEGAAQLTAAVTGSEKKGYYYYILPKRHTHN
jgi:hypothetical protein